MASKRTVVMEKKERKTPRNQRGPLGSATAREVLSSPVASGAPTELIAAFDPRLFLTKLSAGKTSREYQGDESVFSQGDAADAVFYIQSGKVKLTVVSKQRQRSRGCHPAGR